MTFTASPALADSRRVHRLLVDAPRVAPSARQVSWVCIALTVGVVLTSSPMSATAAVDSVVAPAGAIADVPVSGTLGPMARSEDRGPSDTDWWTLSVAGKTQLRVAFAFSPGCRPPGETAEVYLADFLGEKIVAAPPGSVAWSQDGSGSGEITWTTRDRAEPLYVAVYGTRNGCGYRLAVSPVTGLVSSLFASFPVRHLGEPTPLDDTQDQARGPLRAGITYTGRADSQNDPDWVFLRAKRNAVVDVYAESAGVCADGLPSDFSLELETGTAKPKDPFKQSEWYVRIDRRAAPGTGSRARLRFQAAGGSVYLRLLAAGGCPWQIRVLPESAVVKPTATGCRRARRDLASVDRRLEKARRALSKGRSRTQAEYRRRAKRVRALSRMFADSATRVQEECQ